MSNRIPAVKSRDAFSVVLLAAIVGLTLATAWIHFNLGGLLFLLNAAGYAALAAAVMGSSVLPVTLIQRLGWLPRLALIGYAGVTIAAWAVMGPYFQLAYIAKAIEAVLIAVLLVDIYRSFGGPIEIFNRARATLSALREVRFAGA